MNKIIQIIPATQPAWAVYDQRKWAPNEPPYCFGKIHMWALVEDEDGNRFVQGMDVTDEPTIADDMQNFLEYIDCSPEDYKGYGNKPE